MKLNGKNIITILLIVFIIIFSIDKCSSDKRDAKYEKERLELKKENDSLKSQAEKDSSLITKLENKVKVFSKEKDSLKNEVTLAKNERITIIKEVEKLPETSLDSIIAENTSSEHKKRETVQKLLEYPILKKENNLLVQELKATDSIVDNLNAIVEGKDNLIDNKNKQITNLQKQVALCEDQLNKHNNNMYAYGEFNLNGWDKYGVGVDCTIRDKVITGISGEWDDTHKVANVTFKIGFKIK